MIHKHSLDANLFYQFGRWLARWTPEWYCRTFARGMADLTMLRDGELLAIKVEHYRHLFPHLTERDRWRLARQCFRNYASAIVDTFCAMDLAPRRLQQFIVERQGEEHFEAARALGRGLIVVSGHLGSWELGGGYISQHGMPVAVLSKAEDDNELEQYRRRYRQRAGARTIVVGRDPLSLLEAARFLRDAGVLVTMGDVLLGGPSTVVPFAGNHVRFPAGWVTLAASTGAPVVPCFVVPRRERRFAIVMKPAITVAPFRGAGRDAAVHAAVAEYAAGLAPHVLAHPEWWLAFRPMFEAAPQHADGHEPQAPPPASSAAASVGPAAASVGLPAGASGPATLAVGHDAGPQTRQPAR